MTSPSSWWKRPCAHVASVNFLGWDTEANADCVLDYADVGIWLPISATEASQHFKRCKSPQELWDFLRALDSEPEATLQREFNYTGPTETRALDISAEMVDDIMKDIEI